MTYLDRALARQDVFQSAGAYEMYVGRWSRPAARDFVRWLHPAPGLRWLDVGCGTGAFTSILLTAVEPASVHGIDPSRQFVEHARTSVVDPRASFSVGNAMNLEFEDAAFDAAAATLVLNFVPDPQRGAQEMTRVVRPGGIVAAYVWDYAREMRMMRMFWDAAIELNPAAAELDEGRRFTICDPDALANCFSACGLTDVGVTALEVDMRFRDFDDYWTPFLGGQAPAPAYAVSLSEPDRDRLRDLIRSRLPAAADGSIALVSRAWAARGRVPGTRASDALVR
jgi:SAM-dependent methyltransferase